jgi:6-phosphogluconate dehydrogenase
MASHAEGLNILKSANAGSAMVTDAGLERFGGRVADSGEGRRTVAVANDVGVPAHVLTAALFARFSSRGLDEFQNKVLSAMRFGFGGHVEKA